MAIRMCFIPSDKKYVEEVEINFKYYSGFAVSQKQKSIVSLHDAIRIMYPNEKILEISTKSDIPLGVNLSAFNLKLDDGMTSFSIENVYQSSKVFSNGGPYKDLLTMKPHEAKKDARLQSSGDICNFEFGGEIWELEPKTAFYDWIYIQALYDNPNLASQLIKYSAFTDIEFNHNKSINCQARSAAMYVSLYKRGMLTDVLNDKEKFLECYSLNPSKTEQLTFI